MMTRELVFLLFFGISQCLCAVTWISPLDGNSKKLAEDKRIYSLICSLNATSTYIIRDEADYFEVVYPQIAFVMFSQTPSEGKFGIRNTNELYLRAGLDYEATTSYEVVIRAQDKVAGKKADIKLNILITDVNDEAPVITSDTVTNLQTNTAVGSVVFTVTSTDKDIVGTVNYYILVTWISPLDGNSKKLAEDKRIYSLICSLNATSTYIIRDEADYFEVVYPQIAFVMFSQTPSEGKFGIRNTNELYLRAGLDYEATTSYEVVIRAQDKVAGKKADIKLNILITDVNDEAPVITSDTVTNLQTNTAVGSVVFTVTSTDKDIVGTVNYYILAGNVNTVFDMNTATGEISLREELNITVTTIYILTIEATDGIHKVTQDLYFYLTYINWVTPQDGQTGLVAESATTNSTIITLNAKNAFAYSFVVDPESEESKFRIRNNALMLEQLLDYETTKAYTFTFKALGTWPSAVITYTVNVTDVNDEPPVFAAETVNLDLMKDTNIGTIVLTAEVTDPDTVGNSTFSIVDGNTNADFSIATMTGNLTLAKKLDPYVTSAYILVIVASDSVYTATMTLSITVNTGICVDPPVANANSARTFTKSHATYTCNTGYSKAAGDDVLTCNEDGKWIGTIPICFADVSLIQNWIPALSSGAFCGLLSLAIILVVAIIFVIRRHLDDKVCKRTDNQVETDPEENGGNRDYTALQHSQASIITPTYYDSLTYAEASTNAQSTESETYANTEM